ncbi:MAG TPA: hypothetical protein VK005_02695 [Acholeplasma sp.]|nr:hypothetical protein [Acholeplasma sp.]
MKPIRFIIVLLIELVLVALLHLFWINVQPEGFSTYISLQTVSDSLFVMGILIFLPSLVAITGAYASFFALRYALGVLVSSKFKSRYPQYRDYISTKNTEIKTTIFLEIFLSSLLIIIAGLILLIWIK